MLILLALLFQAAAMANPECRTELRTPEIELYDCTNDYGLRTVSLTLRPSLQPPLTVEASYDLWLSSLLPQRIRGASERRRLTAADQALAQSYLLAPGPSESSRGLLRFLAFFAEPGFEFADFDLSGRNLLIRASFVSICGRIGHSQTATYTLGDRSFSQKLIVGGSKCTGQCGAGCLDPTNPRNGRYTQECLNHDACATATGDNLGDCADEFWAAADGFFSAPVCQ